MNCFEKRLAGREGEAWRTPFEGIAPEEGFYQQKRRASVDVEKQRGKHNEKKEERGLQAEVDPLADAAAVRTVELIGGVCMKQGEDGEEKEIEKEQRDADGPPPASRFAM
ncbi:MAG: hypothetical protein HYR88_05975 [Verrucomicrobia bacterium]|nr:hypothetical protein [Verrucomicrobiota bacterium]